MSLYLGIDIGGTKIAGAVVTEGGEVVRSLVGPTPAQEGGAAVLRAAITLACELHSSEVVGVGVGAGGQIDAARGVVVGATDILPGWAGTPVRAALEEALGLPVSVDNDVHALAVGEGRFGAARGRASVVFLALGTGVGGALLLEGHIYHGAHWAGAEFGHILLTTDENARRDTGGHVGTLEAYASGPGLLRTWREITGDWDSEWTARAILDKPGGSEAITRTGEYLGYGLVSLVHALDPEVVVIGGGLAALGDALLDPARDVLRRRALSNVALCPVVAAQLGPDASVIGAAALAMPSFGNDPV
jgi:glucokinase